MAIVEEVHRRGGAVIHTHPLMPPHQLHWMGAAEFLSDAVLGRTADALDIDGRGTELLWFAALNLGNRVAASGSTDAALGRKNSPSPGDRRVYCQTEEFTYPAIVAAIRDGRTVATNGGPLFPILTIDGRGPGSTIEPSDALALHAEIHGLHPLRSVRLIRNGALARDFPAGGRRGTFTVDAVLSEPADARAWYLLKVEDAAGDWAITSPIHVGSPPNSPAPEAAALILEIHNATRFIELRRRFFAHLIATVDPGDGFESVDLIRDGEVVRRFRPAEGDNLADGQVPVTGPDGEYAPGWIWQPGPAGVVHLQADWPIEGSGWYGLRATTVGGRTIRSDEIRFDAGAGLSSALSTAHLEGPSTALDYRGYGEEMSLDQIRLPFEGDHWWYPDRPFWSLRASFGPESVEAGGGSIPDAADRFRPPPGPIR